MSGEALECYVQLSWLFARWILYNYQPCKSEIWRFVYQRKIMASFEGRQTVKSHSYKVYNCFITSNILHSVFPFYGPKIFRVKTSVVYLLILTVYFFPQSFSVILLIENVQTVTVSFENETLSICVLIYCQTGENYREIHHFLALTKVLINQLATSAIVVFCMTYCLYTVKWKRMKLGKTTDQKNTFRTTAMLIFIMLIFILGKIPSTVVLCFKAFGTPQWVNKLILSPSANIILQMTFAANIWVYLDILDLLFFVFQKSKWPLSSNQ